MRVTIEGDLTLAETKELCEAVQRIEQHDPQRVVGLFFHEAPTSTMWEWVALCKELGLEHALVVPADRETKIGFERGGNMRLIPGDTGQCHRSSEVSFWHRRNRSLRSKSISMRLRCVVFGRVRYRCMRKIE